jgi:hypothetical protein
MKFTKEALNVFLFGNIFIAACSTALCIHTTWSFGDKINYQFLLFIFLSTVSSYCFHAYFRPISDSSSERSSWIAANRKCLLYLSILSAAGAIPLLFLVQDLFIYAIPLAFLTLLYTSPRFKKSSHRIFRWIIYWKTFYLAIIWTLVTFALPVLLSGVTHVIGLTAFGLGRFLFILQICLLFEYHDRENNRRAGLKILVNNMSDQMFSLVFLLTSVILQLTSLYYLSESNLEVFLSILLPELSLIILYKKALTAESDQWYSLVIDGHLILPPVILKILSTLI